jgi:ABC-type nitrate/sulfonate/bicarbonate transport system permease component
MSPLSLIRHRDRLLQALVLVGLVSVWELSSRAGWVHPFLLPPPSDVLARLFADMQSGVVFVDLGLTLYRAVTGFVIAAVSQPGYPETFPVFLQYRHTLL